jgi:hypothetical protein
MAEMNSTEDRLTTADIAARTANPAPAREEVATGNSVRRMVVQSETTDKGDWNNAPATTADQQVQAAGTASPLFSDTDIGDLRSRWSNVQAEFVDEPRRAVEQADQLVATVMQRLAEGFAQERGSLEKQWDSGETASTEELRMALQRYRTFFNKLLNAA